MTYRKIQVLVETLERTVVGFIHKPESEGQRRLSDYLNEYDRCFVCLTDVEIKDRGQHHRVGDKRAFIAIALSAICYITPLEDDH